MTTDLHLTAWAIVLTWAMVIFASTARTNGWTLAGLMKAFGNRDDLPDASALAGRADRAAKNMLENLVLFVGLIAVVHLAGRDGHRANLGAHIWFWARVAYWPIYLLGLRGVRTAVWSVSVVGLAILFSTTL